MGKSEKEKKKHVAEAVSDVKDVEMAEVDVVCAFTSRTFASL
jgi:hypothetical protein